MVRYTELENEGEPGGAGPSRTASSVGPVQNFRNLVYDLDPHMWARKSLQQIMAEVNDGGRHRLKRELGPVGLVALGIGGIIGSGIFVLVGKAAHDCAGPALSLSFIVAGTACACAGLCYSEFASMASVAGSAYTYAYVTLGELAAWIIGWDLVLEYAVSSAFVAHGWSHYFQDLIAVLGGHWPHVIGDSPWTISPETGRMVTTGALFDLPAIGIVAVITALHVRGIRESANFNAAMVVIKIFIVLFVIVVGACYVKRENWTPFAPYGYGGVNVLGLTLGQRSVSGQPVGVIAGASLVFFAYIGFDAVSTQAEEAINPERDMPIGILGSLGISTILYILVSIVLTGMIPYDQIDKNAPVSTAFGQVGLPWARLLVSIGALTGITSVLLAFLLGLPRIFLAMARDGLLPEKFFMEIHEKYRTPWKTTILNGIFVAAGAALLPLDVLAEVTNIGTLFAFCVVCVAVLVMRKVDPDMKRPFKVPFVPFVPVLGFTLCGILMLSLGWPNWARLFIWMFIGLGIYYSYGRHNSKLRIAAGVARGTGTGRVSDGVELTESKGLLARGGAGAAGDAGDEEGGAAAAEGSGRTANIGEGGDREDGEGEIVHRAVGGRRRAGGGGDNNAEEDDWSSGVVAGGGAAGGRGFALAGGRGR